jgi:esterase/lipase superfamily enzyme
LFTIESVAVPVLFTWASRGKIGAYIYDTNSATTARDDLEHTLRLLFASDADQINILAHSMGNWVTLKRCDRSRFQGSVCRRIKLDRYFSRTRT